MQSALQSASRSFTAARLTVRPARRAAGALRCQAAAHDMKKVTKEVALAAAAVGLLLGQPGMVEARVPPPTQFEQSRAQEAELVRILKERGVGGVELKESPKVVEEPKAEAPAPVKAAPVPAPTPVVVLEETVVVVEAPKPVTVVEAPAPAPVAAAPVVAAPVEAAGAEEGVSQNTLILGGLALVAVVGVSALGSSQQQGDAPAAATVGAPAASAPAAAAPALSPEEDAARRRQEVKAWIQDWRDRTANKKA